MALIQELETLRNVGRHSNIVSLVGVCSFEGNVRAALVIGLNGVIINMTYKRIRFRLKTQYFLACIAGSGVN